MIKFNLKMSADEVKLEIKDSVFLVGSSKLLGEWNLNKAIELKPKMVDENNSFASISSVSSSSSIDAVQTDNQTCEFEAFVNASSDQDKQKDMTQFYKYFIAQKTSEIGNIFVKQVEHGWRKLNVDLNSGIMVLNDKWPYTDENDKFIRIDNGWLVNNENEYQFHFFDKPLQLWSAEDQTQSKSKYFMEIKPWKKASKGLGELNDYTVNHIDFNESQILIEKNTEFNALNHEDFYTSFRIRSFENPSNLVFQIKIFEINESGQSDQKAFASCFYKVNKALLESSLVEVEIPVLSSNEVIGSLKTEILLTTSISETQNYNLTKNFNYHFKKSCIPIGHRGMGRTFDSESLPETYYVENTIDSFREAYKRGAQMVEFDIVLTKDKIPIIYHDFTFCIDHNQNDLNTNKYIDIAVNQLTYDEIKQNRIYSHKIMQKSTNFKSTNEKENFTSKFMFPTLNEMCTQLDSKLGFNVEIKYPLDLEDGSHEIGNHIKWLNRNEYVDVIIKELYKCCVDDERCVILTTFDPSLCSMLRMKQNKFPVLFLTNGITQKWVPYKDFRCKNTQISFNFAKAEGLNGIVAHAEELTRNLHLINIIFSNTSKSAHFLGYCWGDDLNEVEKRKLFAQHGIDGIIYDRINEIN